MHLAWHHGSNHAACGAFPQRIETVTMNPALVDCGNCKRTTLYRIAIRVTEQVNALNKRLRELPGFAAMREEDAARAERERQAVNRGH
jgi:hypothetical protein